VLIGEFDGAIVDHTFENRTDDVLCVRLVLKEVISKRGIPNWLLIEEISILS